MPSAPAWRKALQPLQNNADLVLLGGLMLFVEASGLWPNPLLAKGAPLGIQTLGIVSGARLSLLTLGIVLILRSSRVINFAQAAFGGLGGFLFYELVRHSQFVQLAHLACPPCFHGVNPDDTFNQSHGAAFTADLLRHGYKGLVDANWWLSLAVALIVGPLLAYIAYVLVISRFDQAPRLVATVATLAMGSFIAGFVPLLQNTVFQDRETFSFWYQPFGDAQITVQSVPFHVGDVVSVAVVAAVCVGLVVFFRLSRAGIAIRGAAENPQRAQTLGISVSVLSGIAWSLAGLLSVLSALLTVISTQGTNSDLTGLAVPVLVEILTAAVIARMTNLPVALVASLALSVLDQVMFWNLNSRVPFQVVLLVVVAGALLLQRYKPSRAEEEATASYLAAKEARPIPAELRNVPVVEASVRWFGLGLGALLIGYPLVMSPGQVSLGSAILIYGIVGLSLLVLTGWAGQISLGQFAFAAIGAYVAALLRTRANIDIALCLAGGACAGTVIAVVVGIPSFKLRGLYLAVTTLAFALATSSLVLNPTYLGRYLPTTLDRPVFLGLDLNDEKYYFYFCLVWLVLAVIAVAGLRRSRTARALIACRDNEHAGQSYGISLFRARLEAFGVSGFLAALAGGLFAFQLHGIDPIAFDAQVSVNIFLATVIGGLGSIAGPLLGATYNGALVLFSNPIITIFGTGAGTLGLLLVFPGGLGGLMYRIRDAMLRRVAVRHRILVPSLLADMRRDTLSTKAPIAPRLRAGGGTLFVPRRYRLRHGWPDTSAPEQPVV